MLSILISLLTSVGPNSKKSAIGCLALGLSTLMLILCFPAVFVEASIYIALLYPLYIVVRKAYQLCYGSLYTLVTGKQYTFTTFKDLVKVATLAS